MKSVLLKIEKIGTFIFSSIVQGEATTGVWRVIDVPEEVPDEEVWEKFSRLMIEPIIFDDKSKGEIIVPYDNLQSDKRFWRTISDNLKRVRMHLGMTQGEVSAAMGYGEQFQKRFSFWEGGNRIPSERFSRSC